MYFDSFAIKRFPFILVQLQMSLDRHIHIHNRFGFGANGKELKTLRPQTFDSILSSQQVSLLNVPYNEMTKARQNRITKEDKRAFKEISKVKLKELQVEWMMQMLRSESMVQEKMSLFWHHHFACIIKNPLHASQFSNVIMKNALGDFRKLLLGVSQSAAMINFLHSKQNVKSQPNEDFARELLELFTLGRGNEYSEQDIQEIARCFTGWKAKFDGSFFIKENQHDYGQKTIFGVTDNFGGEEVIHLILKKKACARFISKSVYQYFVNHKVNEKELDEITEVFYASDYDIKSLISAIVDAEWFYKDEHVMSLIKSPVQMMVHMGRHFRLRNKKIQPWLKLGKVLDQQLYKPLNVEGWKMDKEWIDSNSLPIRLRLPSVLLTDGLLEIVEKPDYDSNPNTGMTRGRKTESSRLGFSKDWAYFFHVNEGEDVLTLLFNGKLSAQAQTFLQARNFDSQKELVIQLMSLPEYQLM